MTISSIEKIYEFSLLQMVAESYIEDSTIVSDQGELRRLLRLGTNREGYNHSDNSSLGDPDLNQGWPGLTRMTDPQIDEFLSKFDVVHQWSDNPCLVDGVETRPEVDTIHTGGLLLNGPDMLANTGFSATLIREKESGHFTLSIRSTESRDWEDGGDAERDLTDTDLWGVTATGFALAQLDALEKYYQWLKDNNLIPTGSTLNVTGYSLGGHLATVFTEIHKDDPYLERFGETVTFNGAGRGSWNGSMGTEAEFLAFYRQVLNDPASVTLNSDEVTDISLAHALDWGVLTGFLTDTDIIEDLVTRLRAVENLKADAVAVTSQPFDPKTIYDDARYGWAVVATMLKFGLAPQLPGTDHGTLADDRITQVYGFETIVNHNMTANSQNNGPELAIGIESQPVLDQLAGLGPLPGDYGFSHSINLLADSLALQRAMQGLDNALAPEQFIAWLPYVSTMRPVDFIGTNYEADALENILDGMRRVFLGLDVAATAFKEGAGGYGDWLKRNEFHLNIVELVESNSYERLSEHVALSLTNPQLASSLDARNSFSQLLALVDLSPFAVNALPGEEALVEQVLAGVHAELFEQWQSDKAVAAPEYFTDLWMQDRCRHLQWTLLANARNSDVNNGVANLVAADAPESGVQFEDMASGETLRVVSHEWASSALGQQLHQLVFGSMEAEDLLGGDEEDRLYGMSGADTLEGGGDNDYLEGGAGIDTYVWSRGDGEDRILEIDEEGDDVGGRLRINGETISTVTRRNSGVYEAAGCFFLRIEAPDDGELLLVQERGGVGGLRIYNYDAETNNFGIIWATAPVRGAGSTGAALAAGAARRPVFRDPLALDLDGDGLETVGIVDGGAVLFDHDGDGIRTGTGWVGADDGWLVMDRNDNGRIDNGSELFGVDTLLQDGSHAGDGFAALREWDENFDGMVTAADAVFISLGVWRDLNQDGQTQAGELLNLDELGIIGIGVNGTPSPLLLGGGNVQTAAGSFTRSDGSTGSTGQIDSLAANLDLLTNTFYSDYTDTVALTAAAMLLPEIAGSGRVRDLREAASLAPELLATLQDYAQQPSRDAQLARIDAVLAAWADTSDFGSLQQQFAALNAQGNPATLTYRLQGYPPGTPAHAEMLRRIGVVEAFMGFTYTGDGIRATACDLDTGDTTVSLLEVQLQAINRAYELFRNDIYNALLPGTRLQPYAEALPFTAMAGEAPADFSAVEGLFLQAIAADARTGVTDLVEFIGVHGADTLQALGWSAVPFLAQQLTLAPELAGFSASLADGSQLHIATAGQWLLSGSAAAEVLISRDSGAELQGLAGNDVLVGQGGQDSLLGGAGDDMLYGGLNNDTLQGGGGRNTYLYRTGEGNDHVYCALADGEAGSLLRILGGAAADTTVALQNDVLVFRFAGTDAALFVHDFFTGVARPANSDGYADQGISAVAFDDGTVWSIFDFMAMVQVQPGDAGDSIVGYFTDDFLQGLGGHDYLAGGAGGDVLQGGDGNDTLAGDGNGDVLHGGAGNDALAGGDGDDILSGGLDSDQLAGGIGNDLYVFAKGDGQDRIVSPVIASPLDRDEARLAYRADETVLRRVTNDLVITFSGSTDTITVRQYFQNDGTASAAQVVIVSADGLRFDYATVKRLVLLGGAGDETLIGFDTADDLRGGAGNDTLQGGGGDDRLEGGAGNDMLGLDPGNDTFVFGAGGGHDEIRALGYLDPLAGVGADTLQMAALLPADVRVSRLDADRIVIQLNGSDDRIALSVSAPGFADVQVAFADGTTWRAADLIARAPLSEGDDTLFLLDGDDRLHMLGGNDVVDAGGGSDTLHGDAGNDTLHGDTGDDYLYGNTGDDTLLGEDGSDNLEGHEGADLLDGGAGDDILNGGAGSDRLFGGAGDDWLVEDFADAAVDTLTGGEGNDIYGIFESSGKLVELAGGGLDSVQLYFSGSWKIPDFVENITLSWLGGGSQITGNAENNYIDARYSTAADTLAGGLGDDTYYHITSADQVTEASGGGNDTVFAAVDRYSLGQYIENATLIESSGSGVFASLWMLDGNDGNNVLANRSSFKARISGRGGDDIISGGSYADTLYGDAGNDELQGGGGGDYLYGGSGSNTLFGGSGGDTLYAQGSNDTLSGGAGHDTLMLGSGHATCVVSSGDLYEYIVAGAGQFTLDFQDAVASDLYVKVSDGGQLEIAYEPGSVVVMETAALDRLDQVITRDGTLSANAWFDWLRSTPGHYTGNIRVEGTGAENTAGARYIAERSGNDLVIGAVAADGQGIGSFSLKNLTPMDTASDHVIEPDGRLRVLATGSGPTTIRISDIDLQAGSAQDDDFLALAGNGSRDWFAGGEGSDVYGFGRQSGADIIDAITPDAQRDVVLLEEGIHLSDLRFDRSLDDLVISVAGGSPLTVRQYFRNESASPAIFLADGQEVTQQELYFGLYGATPGNDVINGSAWHDTLFGWSGDDVLSGFDGDDRLEGGEGSDRLEGGMGNDSYVLRDQDTVVELAGEGADTVEAWVDALLAANVEAVRLQGSAALSATGNGDRNYLYGNDGANRLDGGADADFMWGGDGDDIYIVDNAGDYTGEADGEGRDTVEASVAVTLAQNVENLALIGSAVINGTGNEIDNVLRGNSAANVLTGGLGNDTYYVGAGDSVSEASGGGIDTVISDVSLTLLANVENLRLAEAATALLATGNQLVNQLYGNSLDNTLDGGASADVMAGGGGNDSYRVDNVGDVIAELRGEGIDTVQSIVSLKLAAEIENLTLTGNGALSGTGNELDNILTGNSGANVLTGGLGNDTYVVGGKDSTVEKLGEGMDTVQSSVAWTLAAHLENLVLTGTAKISGTGNELDNRLTGNSAANTLKGGKGDDTYLVGTGDTVTEIAGEGFDTVESTATWTLGNNLENLTLTGSSATNGTGNAMANRLRGNSNTNTLTGGAGSDTYLFGRGGGADTVVDSDSTAGNADRLLLDAGIDVDQLWFRHVGSALEISVIGTADRVTVSNWYGGAANHVERIQVADGHYLVDGQVEQLVQAMAAMTPPGAGQYELSASQHQQLDMVLAASWQTG